MYLKVRYVGLLLFSLFLFFSCSSLHEIPKAGNENFGGPALLAMPGAKIDYKKVYSIIHEETGWSFKEIMQAKEPKGLKKIVLKLEQLLQKRRYNDNKGLNFIAYGLLASINMHLYSKINGEKYLQRAIANAKSAISIFEGNPEYKVDLASAYMILTDAYFSKGEYGKAISLLKYLIEEYQSIGMGPYGNWFASSQVERLHNLMERADLKTKRKKKLVGYLKSIAERYNNEVGLTAQLEILRLYLSKDKIQKAISLSQTIKNRLASINNLKFKNKKMKVVNSLMKHVESPHNN